MKQVTTFVGIDAHKKALFVAMSDVVRHLGGARAPTPMESAAAADAQERAHSRLENDGPVFHSSHRRLTTGHSISASRPTAINGIPRQHTPVAQIPRFALCAPLLP
jgi:hypothetical protein